MSDFVESEFCVNPGFGGPPLAVPQPSGIYSGDDRSQNQMGRQSDNLHRPDDLLGVVRRGLRMGRG